MKRVLALSRLRDFWIKHPDTQAPLRDWFRTAERMAWSSLEDIRGTYPHADGVKVKSGKTLIVFNIGGNKYRLVADVLYKVQVIYVCTIMTHAEYDKNKWKETL